MSYPLSNYSLREDYDFKLKHYLNIGTENEIAVIDFKSKMDSPKDSKIAGSIFVKTKFDNISKILYEYSFQTGKNVKRKEKIEVSFKENKEGFAVFESLNIVTFANRTKSVSKVDENIWFLAHEEIKNFGEGKSYSAFVKNDLKILQETPYNSMFWQINVPIKYTKIENDVIKYFEKSQNFKSDF